VNRAPAPLSEYLRARRSVTTPEQAGVSSHTRRRVPGLRRDEVARLAGISQEYYLRLEQGYYGHPYDLKLHALADRLSALDPFFRTVWERHDVDPYNDGDVRPEVAGFGQVVLHHQTLVIPGTPGYLLAAYHAQPGTPSADALAVLAARIDAAARA